jgi:hypothetical protein
MKRLLVIVVLPCWLYRALSLGSRKHSRRRGLSLLRRKALRLSSWAGSERNAVFTTATTTTTI